MKHWRIKTDVHQSVPNGNKYPRRSCPPKKACLNTGREMQVWTLSPTAELQKQVPRSTGLPKRFCQFGHVKHDGFHQSKRKQHSFVFGWIMGESLIYGLILVLQSGLTEAAPPPCLLLPHVLEKELREETCRINPAMFAISTNWM